MIREQFNPPPRDSEEVAFGTLTDIMDRFQQVPFEQFQKELNDWFKRSYAAANKSDTATGSSNPDSFPDKVIEIGNAIFERFG